MILSWGTIVTAIFAAIFLFYMNSFLMRLFHQIYRGGCTNEQLYQKISDTLTMLATGGEQA